MGTLYNRIVWFADHHFFDELRIALEEANTLYRKGSPQITDEEYDYYMEILNSHQLISSTLGRMDPAPVSSSRKSKLPVPMKSLNKVHNIDEVRKWCKSIGVKDTDGILVMPKFDGVSLLIDEKLKKAYSRGGSENEGQDCSIHFSLSPSSHYQSDFSYTYGEFIINKENWEAHFKDQVSPNTGKKYKSSRNTIAGLINSDNPSQLLQFSTLYRYGVSSKDLNGFTCFFDVMCALGKKYNQKEMWQLYQLGNITDEKMQELYSMWNKNYQIDGLVLYINDLGKWKSLGRSESTGNPNYAIAYKSPNFIMRYETEVLGINWKVSKSGAIKPTVQIQTIDTGDCEINCPTGYNANWICGNSIAKGAVVTIVRSGAVIPKIIKVNKPAPYEEIEELWDNMAECPECGCLLTWSDGDIDLQCTNKNCSGIKLAKIVHFFTTVGCDNIGDKIFNKLFHAGFNTIYKILNVGYKDIMSIEGMGESIANFIISNNDRIKKGLDVLVLMHASDCFELIGQVKAKKILQELTEDELNGFYNCTYAPQVDINSVNKTKQSFYGGLGSFYKFLSDNQLTLLPLPKEKEPTNSKFAGMYFCFSGFRDKEMEDFIIDGGGTVSNSVSKKTSALIVKDVVSSSSKVDKAKKLGVKIHTIEGFKMLYNS